MTTDIDRITKNTGFSREDIEQVKDHVFYRKHDLGRGMPENFDPVFMMAQSWQRLIDGKDVKPHDILLLRHEMLESELMKKGLSQNEAHEITGKQFNYAEAAKKYYAKISKHQKDR
jgi:hypothetical protein